MVGARRVTWVLVVVSLMSWSFISGYLFHKKFETLNPFGDRDIVLAQAAASGAIAERLRSEAQEDELGPVAIFWEVLNQIKHRYYKPIEDEKKLAYGAAKGLTRALDDPYSRFMPPEEAENFNVQTDRELDGIGAELTTEFDEEGERRIVIHRPLPNSPAAEAGLRPGDWIIGVDDEPTSEMDLTEVVRKIRGPRGTKVKLTIFRKGVPKPFEVTVERKHIEFNVVHHKVIDGDIGYARLEAFNDKSFARLNEALDDLLKQNMKGFILDLRDNTGGLLDSAIKVCSLFVKSGPVVYIQPRDQAPGALDVDPTWYRGIDMPIVVLINGRTASASEIVAGCLQDNGIARLVGEKTYGKGLVQTVITLQDNSALALTTARYLTPKKRDIDAHGIEPDVPVPMELSDEDYKLWTAGTLPLEKDVQLQAAIKEIRRLLDERG